MSALLLTCNAGSHSLKCAVYDAQDLHLLYRFSADRIHETPTYELIDADQQTIDTGSGETGYEAALSYLLQWLHKRQPADQLVAAAHRVVHGGHELHAPIIIDDQVRAQLDAIIPLAPLHQPYNLALIDVISHHHPKITQVACFDTAFHRTQPWLAQQFALPRSLTESEHVMRYGFHGLSYDYVAGRLAEVAGKKADGRIIVLHLGGGASACAMHKRKSVASSMGFTALDGLMMATRCGDIDPGILLYLMQEKSMSVAEVEALLYQQSGLLGVSGLSSDMRDLRASNDPKAHQAIELFAYMAAKQIGALMMALGGIDALVLTGAMGCGDAALRQSICDYLGWLGCTLDTKANQQHQCCISAAGSAIDVYRLPTDEEAVMAQQAKKVLS